ncbi:MAG: hypothetical protein ACPG4Z_01710 [Chitinophagales bacterium]
MKKFKILLLVTSFLFVGFVDAAIYIKYYNKDSNSYEFDVKTCGSSKTVEFKGSTTSSVTIQSGCDEAVIYTDCGEITVKDDAKVTIKDGCIIIE